MTEQMGWWGKQPSQVACVSTCGCKAKDITPLTARRREAWKEEALNNLPWERTIINQTNIGTVSKATLGNLLRDRVECIVTILNWTVNENQVQTWFCHTTSTCSSNRKWQASDPADDPLMTHSFSKTMDHFSGLTGHETYCTFVVLITICTCNWL